VELVRLLLLPKPQVDALLKAVGNYHERWMMEGIMEEEEEEVKGAEAAAGIKGEGGGGEGQQAWQQEAEERLRCALQQLAEPAQPSAAGQPASKRRKVDCGSAGEVQPAAASVAGVLLAVCLTMCRRYAGGLEADEALEARLDELPARLHAALLARLQEKRGWAALLAQVEGSAALLARAALDVELLLEGAKQVQLSMQGSDSDSDDDHEEGDDGGDISEELSWSSEAEEGEPEGEEADEGGEDETLAAPKKGVNKKGSQQSSCCDSRGHCSHKAKKGKGGRE
jgi:hypothetical protein